MSDIKTIWVDQTDMMSWQGNLTGIQRTVYNLGKNFKKRNDVKFFYFEPTLQKYFECDFIDPFANKIEKQAEVNSKAIARSILKVLPRSVKHRIKKVVIKPSKHNSTGNAEALFKARDLILVLGGNWGDDSLGFLAELKKLKSSKKVSIVHFLYDLIPVKFPNYYIPGSTQSYINYLDELVEIADKLLCISKNTKNDLEAYVKNRKTINKPKIGVIRLGEDISTDKKESIRDNLKDKIQAQFIICVGTIEARKNQAMLYYVFKEALKRKISIPQILIVGKRGWMTTEIQNTIDNDPETQGKLFIIDDASDAELKWMYTNCIFTVYPSFYEGWGLPIAEAANYNKLCLASNTSSMPEVVGEYADYFSPYNTNEFLEKILYYSENPGALKNKENKLKNRPPFTWQDSYMQLIKDIQS